MSKKISVRRSLKLYFALLAVLALTAFVPAFYPYAASAEETVRLRFSNAIDTNVYTDRLVREVFSRLGIEVSVAREDMNTALSGADAGIYDGICSQSEIVAASYDELIAVPVETAVTSFYALTVSGDSAQYEEWQDFSGKKVGTLTGKTFIESALPGDIAAHIKKPSMSILYESLEKGECDVIVITDTSAKAADKLVMPAGFSFAGLTASLPCHIYLNKKHAEWVAPVAFELDKMKADGSLDRIKEMKPLQEREEKSVFYLSSFSSEVPWEQNLVKGIGNVLDRHGDIMYHNIALNSFRNTDAALQELTALSAMAVDFINTPPDAVIVSDDEAMNFLMCNYNSILSNDVPVIFCGINDNAQLIRQNFERYNNFQGVIETVSAAETVEQMLKLFPKTKEIYVINDHTLSGRKWKSEIERQLSEFNKELKITYNGSDSVDGLLKEVAALNSDTLVLCGSYYLDSDSFFSPQPLFQSALYEASPVPVFGLLDTSKGYGQIGGKYLDSVKHAEAAAEIAVRILRSGDMESFTLIERASDSRFVFDRNIMKQFGISKNKLPKGAALLNDRVSIREADPVFFYSAVIGLSALGIIVILMIVFLVLLRRRNFKLEAAREEMRHSNERVTAVTNHLQTILETAPIAYSLLVDDVVVESNRYYKTNVGTAEGQKNSTKYADTSRYFYYIDECRKKGFVDNIYWPITKKNGEYARFLFNIAMTEWNKKEAIVFWGVDIEQLEQQKDALNRAYFDLQELIGSTPLPIALLSPEDKSFIYVNTSWRKLFAIPEMLNLDNLRWNNKSVLTVKPMTDLINKAMTTDGIFSKEWEFETYEGERFAAIVYFKKIIYGGKECLVITHRDLREERAREKMLQNAAEKEREANSLKSHFLMNMSHEIKTPMNAIIGISQLAKNSDGAPELFESIVKINQAASVLMNIINNVLDLSLIEDGRMVLKPEKFSLTQSIESVDMVVGVAMDKKNLGHSVNLDGIVHDVVFADRPRLEQVMLALADNALKFTSGGGKVSLTVKETGEEGGVASYLFCVEDTGVGIPPEKMKKLFRPFEQGDDSITRQYGGAGLGLSIAKKIVELSGGEIWVESEPAKGSKFFFTMKFDIAKDCAPVQEAQSAPQQQDDFSNLRVLLVDDVEINRIIASELLLDIGITADEAENGKQAVEMVQNSEPGYYGLVFMDIQMPVMDGCSAAKAIRNLENANKNIPIVAMTANTMPDDVAMILESGMNDYIGKPVFLEQLIEIIKGIHTAG